MTKWIVGVDLRHRSDGAVRFAAWLHQRCRGGVELVGLHVAAKAELDTLERFEGRPRLLERLQTESALVVDRAGAGEGFRSIEVIEDEDPSRRLEAARSQQIADGLIVGRKAASDGGGVVRLGSVARRLLRRLSAPTFVVPPDLDPETLAGGPVVVAVMPAEASEGAVSVARELAAALGRPLEYVRVVSVPDDYAQIYWSPGALEEFRALQMRNAEEKTSAWLAAHGCVGPLSVRYGEEVEQILGHARERQAPLVVCGSRLLSRLERLVVQSTSSELAARSPVPVLVVPPDIHDGAPAA